MGHPPAFYLKVAGAGFLVGGAMELFMLKTGFYDIVTRLEGEKLDESKEQREEFLRKLQSQYEQQRAAREGKSQ
eukprot:jgi/Tetstr1/453591/TSEL_003985.t1